MIDWHAFVIGPCIDVFGEDLKPLYQRATGGVPFEIDAIFDDAYKAIVMSGDGPEIATLDPVLGVRLAQFGATPPVQGDTVTVPRVAKVFLVVAVEPDGKGHVKLRLNLKAGA